MGLKDIDLTSSNCYLNDYQKYNKNFKRSNYNKDLTDKNNNDSLVNEIRQYYEKMIQDNKELNLLAWMRMNLPSEEMIYNKAAIDQMCFIRDRILMTLTGDYDLFVKYPVKIISTHRSKSICLPVYLIDLKELYGITLILRGNFYNWKVSIDSDEEIMCDFKDLITDSSKIDSVYCEGFKDEWIYDSYDENKKKFTIELADDLYKFFTFMFLLGRYLRENKKLKDDGYIEL